LPPKKKLCDLKHFKARHCDFHPYGVIANFDCRCRILVIQSARCGEQRDGLASMSTTVPSPLALRPREAAKALGISPRLLWQLTKDGQIPCARVGAGKRKSILYSVTELQSWLAERSKGVQS
jgi:hypothetical protein